jgi:outer membrane protein insertion porin family
MDHPRARTAHLILAIAIVVTCFPLSASAQSDYRVVEIEVVGNRVASEALILGVSSLEIGEQLTPGAVAETIRRLYALGIFRDVRIEGDEVPGGLKAQIVVDELPKLAGLKLVGNSKIKDRDLRDELQLGVGGYISPFLVYQSEQKIKRLYAEKGYFLAEVESDLDYTADSSAATLTLTISEKSKIKVEKVVVSGNEGVSSSEAISKMRNRKRGFLRSSDFAQERYQEDLEKFIEAFHNRGYIDAYLLSDSMRIDTSRNRMTIYLDVYEGPRYYFGDVAFKFNEVLDTNLLRNRLRFTSGDVFSADKYEESMMELYTAYHDIGHLHVRIFDERTTRADSIIDVTYEITEGLPARINLVKITGNTKTKEKVIRRELSSIPGDVFNRQLLIRSIRDAMALNYFTTVEPVPIQLPSGDVDIEMRVEEKQTGQVSAGTGYNSQDGVVGNVGMGIPNFRGEGQTLSFMVEFGRNRNSVSVSFTEPWLRGRPTLLGVSGYLTNRNWYDEYTEGRRGASVRVGRRLTWPDRYFRVFTSYRLERNRFFDFSSGYVTNYSYQAAYYYDDQDEEDGTREDAFLGRKVHGPYPGSLLEYGEDWLTASRWSFTILRDSRNLPEFATKGSKVSYTFESTGGLLGGFWKYERHLVSAAKFIPTFWNFTLAAKLEAGAIRAGDDQRILASDRFTPGGTAYDGIIRGYDDGILTPDSVVTQSDTVYYYYDPNRIVGVDQPDDTVFSSYRARVRGNYMLVANLELQFPIIQQQLYGLLFFDAGNSWLRWDEIAPGDLYKGYGFGFRLMIPGIGTMGFDFAKPLDDPPNGEGRGWRPHFQIGTTFR